MKMKYHRTSLLLFLCAILMSAQGLAADKTDYKKHYSKNVPINPDALLEIDADFSSVEIMNWDKNEIDVYIEIIVEARSEDKAEKIFDKITAEITDSKDRVSIEVFKEDDKGMNNTTGWQINMRIKAPKTISLDANIIFGDLDIARIDGKADIDLDFGDLDIDKLSNANSSIDIVYGDADLGHVRAESINLGFGDMDIQNLDSDCQFTMSYGDADIHKVTKQCQKLDVELSFGDLDLVLSSDMRADISAESSFGDVSFSGGIEKTKKESGMLSEELEGKLNGGGGAQISLYSSYGEIDVHVE